MKTINKMPAARFGRLLAGAVSVIALCACSGLRPTATVHPAFYALDGAPVTAPLPAKAAAPTLIINPPHAAAGFDSQRIIYVRENHKLEYFANSEWIDPPARMLGPLLVSAIENTGAFRAVVLTPGAATGDLRLDTEIIRLQHEFQSSPSRVRFTLRAYLVDDKTRRVLAWREFDAAVAATSEDPYGGVIAANRAVQSVLKSLSQFCAETVDNAPLTK
ncbi:MAG: ABC-type transport auxiliary lipoprotein family protein [Rhodoferax sp.]|uniref:ABC-type transport auxiliary lipoprotein family protein n=1 Tax=Rhodoferax sp. TaxID=50421 RepID=UPI0027265F41|nr:ABC-type transport auxiliary lipoprotein family protein [Rhodoferax sp.]MDO8450995.1 ABC-type transport auxiliary lipoprotein family protein [Rhodoferax sp.]